MRILTSLKNGIKWMFCDKFVIFFSAVGIILLLMTLTFFSESVNLIRYRGMNFSAGETAYSRLLLKMTIPALFVDLTMKMPRVETIPQHIFLYSLMFVAQIVIYGIVGKVAGVMSSSRTVAVCICIGIVLLALALFFEINPAQGSVLDAVRGKPFYLFLVISNLPALLAEQCLAGISSNTALMHLILFLVMFIVQIFLYGFLGKLFVNMLPRT